MAEEAFSVGIPQSAKTYYHKASNGNVSIMRLATDLNWAQFALKCNKCQEEHFIKDNMMMATAIHPEIDKFCGEHQHLDWVSYTFSMKSKPSIPIKNLQPGEGSTTGVVTISKAEYLKLIGKLPDSKTAEEPEGRMFRGEDE